MDKILILYKEGIYCGVKSIEHLEMQVDSLEQIFLSSRDEKYYFEPKDASQSLLANQVASVPEQANKKFVAWDSQGQAHTFTIDEDFGEGKGGILTGLLTTRPCYQGSDKRDMDDQIFVCDTKVLSNLSPETLRNLQSSKVLITNAPD